MLSSRSKTNLGRTCHGQRVGTNSWMIGTRQSPQRQSNVTQRCHATLLRGGRQPRQPHQPLNLQCDHPASLGNSAGRSKLSQCYHHRHSQTQRRRWLSTPSAAAAEKDAVVEPTYEQLKMVALAQAIPFVGFGIMDNSILIIAGDAIDTSLGVMLGISTMCAAAIGNIISDVAGIMLGTVVEDFVARWANLPSPNLSNAQRNLRSVRFANQFGCGTGIVIGCIIGMFPLLYIDSHKIERMKREKHIENIFRDVVTEAKTLIGTFSHRVLSFLFNFWACVFLGWFPDIRVWSLHVFRN
jgi:Transmembrane protein 65